MKLTSKLERERRCEALIDALDRLISNDYQQGDKNRVVLGSLKLLLEQELERMKEVKK